MSEVIFSQNQKGELDDCEARVELHVRDSNALKSVLSEAEHRYNVFMPCIVITREDDGLHLIRTLERHRKWAINFITFLAEELGVPYEAVTDKNGWVIQVLLG